MIKDALPRKSAVYIFFRSAAVTGMIICCIIGIIFGIIIADDRTAAVSGRAGSTAAAISSDGVADITVGERTFTIDLRQINNAVDAAGKYYGILSPELRAALLAAYSLTEALPNIS